LIKQIKTQEDIIQKNTLNIEEISDIKAVINDLEKILVRLITLSPSASNPLHSWRE
jgi:hypothetical protein